jgi:hypothetical protein
MFRYRSGPLFARTPMLQFTTGSVDPTRFLRPVHGRRLNKRHCGRSGRYVRPGSRSPARPAPGGFAYCYTWGAEQDSTGIAEKLLGEIPFGACVLVYNMALE